MYDKVKDWTTKSGLRAVVLLVNEGSHHCGYVEVPEDHYLFKKNYSDACLPKLPDDTAIGKRGVISLLCHDPEAEKTSPEIYFDVHGGITFSNQLKNEGDSWWFGYDCAHAGDQTKANISFDFGGVWRDEEYCITECESLASQIKEINFQ